MTTIYVSPDGKPRRFRGEIRDCVTAKAALGKVRAGDLVRFLPGIYRQTIEIRAKGTPTAKIIVQGIEGAKFDLGLPMTPAQAGHLTPVETEGAAIKLDRVEHLVIEGFDFANCWPSAIFARGIRHVTIRDCRADGAQFFLYMRRARNLPRTLCSDITVRGCVWRQDVHQLMWRGIVRWRDVKNPDDVHSAFNGALVGAYAFGSGLKILKCRVTHAFNAVRMDAPSNDNGPHNEDVRIADCDFDHIRDNVVEPEKRFRRWWVSRCRMLNVHAVFSLDHLDGEDLVVAGCQMVLAGRPADISNRGGKVWKMKGEKAVRRVVFVHNSVALAKAYAKEGVLESWRHAANALLCIEPRQPLFQRKVTTGCTSLFVRDVSNDPAFPEEYNARFGFALDGERLEDFLDLSVAADVSYMKLAPRGRLCPGAGADRAAPCDCDIDVPDPDGRPSARASLSLRKGDLIGAIQSDGQPFDIFARLAEV